MIGIKTGSAANGPEATAAIEGFREIERVSGGLIKVVVDASTHAEIQVKSAIESLGRYVGGIVTLWEACPTCRQVFTGIGKATSKLAECVIPNPLFK